LANESFVQKVLLPLANSIGLLVVDEAHCISDWGHDFRPDYRRLVNVLQRMPSNMPVLATTATANNRVLQDVVAQLGELQIQRGPLMRESLALQAMRLQDQSARLAWLAEHVPELPGTGIIYVLTKRDADQVADWLVENEIDARAYYSGVKSDEFETSDEYRQHLEDLLLNNRLKALVATTALGMGYDKPDLGFVVHFQAPSSIIAYYQQVGRAGRAIHYALGVLLSGREDADIQEYFRDNAFPDERHVNTILDALAGDGLTERQIEQAVNLRKGQIDKVLKFLSVDNPSPVLKEGARWVRTPVEYHMDHARIRRLTSQRAREWQEVQEYIDSPDCLMVALARAFDDDTARPCGKCARCLEEPVIAESFQRRTAAAAARYLRHSEFPLKCKIQVAPDAFPEYGFKGNLCRQLRAETGRILSRWGDAGWGRMVADNKHAGHFEDELVKAVVEMMQERWLPDPAPEWVTCVPSRSHPDLVPSFSQRLAEQLGLPFLPVATKIRDNEPQKKQENRFHQCHNLDGVFTIDDEVPNGPVLLLDDMVDSAWTLTVIAALLRQAGSGPVWPVALASTSAGD
jgi:ATP-dependent DNA helicase RecQ